MTHQVDGILNEISKLANDKSKRVYIKQGIQESILGVNLGPLRKLAGTIGKNHQLAHELWDTDIFEARVLASMLFDPSKLDQETLWRLIDQAHSKNVIDELTFEVFETIDNPKSYVGQWLQDPNPKIQRAAWNMAIILVKQKRFSEPELSGLLDSIESQLRTTDDMIQFSMNRCLCEIGIFNDQFTDRCLSIGETLGVYRDMKVSKGCTSPYAPNWIHAVRDKRRK